MATKYTEQVSSKKTSQKDPILGREKDMVKNRAGGYVFKLDEWKKLDRFLIMGVDGNTYYASQKELVVENAQVIQKLIQKDGIRVVDRVVEISDQGRAYKNDPALFVMAMAAGMGTNEVRKYALDQLPKVARIGTHLFTFSEYVKAFRGWGRGLRNGIANWYLSKDNHGLALTAVKYQSRGNWSNRILLKLSHVKTMDDVSNKIFNWMVNGLGKGFDGNIENVKDIPLIYGHELVKKAINGEEASKIIKEYRLPMEAVPTQLRDKKVYETMLPNYGLTALIRNLGNLSKHEILVNGASDVINLIESKITDGELLKKARIHPIQILAALFTYQQGRGMLGSGTWEVVGRIVDALDEAFYVSFGNIVPTGKRFLLALDVSGSMNAQCFGLPILSARQASAAMAMVTARSEREYTVVGFTGGGWDRTNQNLNKLSVLDITPRQRMDDVLNKISHLPLGSTDCALPMLWAKEKKREFDAIIVYTDNETWAGHIQPVQALNDYRNKMGLNTKFIVTAMSAANGFSIADPKDPTMLDVVGFDTNTPNIMGDFVRDEL